MSSTPDTRSRTTSRLMLSVKRTLYMRNPESHIRQPTDEGSTAPPPFHQFRDSATSRPTVEQIAMGLHLSRTPHLRPLPRSSPVIHPPAPTRSSLKKPSSDSSPAVSTPFFSPSASTTTVTSLSTSATNSPKSFAGFKLRMARFLPHNRSFSAPTSALGSPLASPRNSISEAPRKKAVRFTTDEPTDSS